jgi:hypothetical protein
MCCRKQTWCVRTHNVLPVDKYGTGTIEESWNCTVFLSFLFWCLMCNKICCLSLFQQCLSTQRSSTHLSKSDSKHFHGCIAVLSTDSETKIRRALGLKWNNKIYPCENHIQFLSRLSQLHLNNRSLVWEI